jgi:four helix bundle protein
VGVRSQCNGMESSETFENLIVWQKAHQLTLRIYKLTETFPKHEIYGLTSQIRRAAVSVPSNIAEGYARRHSNDKLKFFNITNSSLQEVRYQLILTRDLQYGETADLLQLDTEVSKLINAYSSGIRRNQGNS